VCQPVDVLGTPDNVFRVFVINHVTLFAVHHVVLNTGCKWGGSS
jgi:hypothetical protein